DPGGVAREGRAGESVDLVDLNLARHRRRQPKPVRAGRGILADSRGREPSTRRELALRVAATNIRADTSGRSCGGPEIPMPSVNPLNVIRLVPANGQVLLPPFFARLHPGLLYHGGDRTCVYFKYLRRARGRRPQASLLR